MNLDQIIQRLHALGDPSKVEFKAEKFGVNSTNALGIMHKELNLLVKEIPKSDELATQLFDTGIYEAKILCSKIFNPMNLTEELMEKWITSFNNWEICDSFCMKLFASSKLAIPKIMEWEKREPEFERRASFATMAGYCSSDKRAKNDVFESFFPLIKSAASDDRLYVKKAVNWALRSIGKRNVDLRKRAIDCAEELLKQDSRSASWIAKDAIRELNLANVRSSDYPREIYRPSY